MRGWLSSTLRSLGLSFVLTFGLTFGVGLGVGLGLMPDAQAAGPATVSAAEARQVKTVIEAQLKALSVDDAPAAFSLAAPNIREMFGTPDRFIAMVRSGYPVVYRPASVAYLKPSKVESRQILQAVHLTDADGVLWLALYHLEQQPDKRWRISGCEVAPAQGRVA